MKLQALALVLLCTSGVVSAQTATTPPAAPPGAEQRLDRMATLLDLTAEQKAQVKTVLEAEHAKVKAQMEAARASGTRPTMEQMQAARAQVKADTVQQLSSVLNATQLKKLQVLMDDEHGPGHGGRGGHGPHDEG